MITITFGRFTPDAIPLIGHEIRSTDVQLDAKVGQSREGREHNGLATSKTQNLELLELNFPNSRKSHMAPTFAHPNQ